MVDLAFFGHPSFLVFAAAQAGATLVLVALTELFHWRLIRRGALRARVTRHRRFCRLVVLGLFVVGLVIFSVPAYHPFLGELHFRDALLATDRDDGPSARASFAKAVEHLREIEETEQGGGLWAAAVTRFVEPWGGLQTVRAALSTAHFALGNCRDALRYMEAELTQGPRAARRGLLSYRVAVCHVAADRQEEVEEALLHALLIDRRFAEQARTNPRLRALAEDLLAKRL